MAFKISQNARNIAGSNVKDPHLVLEIDGVSKILATDVVLEYVQIGDEDLLIGGDWLIGGTRPLLDQGSLISFGGTTTQISQQIDIDKGRGSSIQSMVVSLVDKANAASEIVSPGVVVDEILSRRCKIYLGFTGCNFPEDYIVIFRGIIGDVESSAGKVNITIQHPDTKKRQQLFLPKDTLLTASIDDDDTALAVESTDGFLEPVLGPDGLVDESIKYYVRIDDEIIRYTSYDGTNFLGCTRAQLGTTAVAHDDESQVDSYFTLEGNALDLALKLMLSGVNDHYVEELKINSVNNVGVTSYIENAIFIKDVDMQRVYNVTLGDYIDIFDSVEGANNVTSKVINGIGTLDGGTYLTVDDVTFVDELETAASISIRSQYDTLGYGLGMLPEEVDITQHLEIKSRYLSSFDYKFYIKEEIESTKEFIEEQIYMPASCFSLPRKAQSSVGLLTPPIPGDETIVLDASNILNAEQIKIKRSTNKNFLNTVIYRFDMDALEDDKFKKSYVNLDQDSRERIKEAGNKVFDIKSMGMRSVLNAVSIATQAAQRRIDTYKFAAEYIEGVQINYGIGYTTEVGDIIIADFTNLKVTDFNTGNREKPPTLFRIINKRLDIVKGQVVIDILNTGYGVDQVARYGLIGPSSKIKLQASPSKVVVKPSYSEDFGTQEGLKWERYIGCGVVIRSSDYSVAESAIIQSVMFNEITLDHDLGITPVEDYILEIDSYNNQNEIIKLKYVFMTDEAAFDDDKPPYTML